MKRYEVILSAEDLTHDGCGTDHVDVMECRACRVRDALHILPKREMSGDARSYVMKQLEKYPIPRLNPRDLCESDNETLMRWKDHERFHDVLQTILDKLGGARMELEPVVVKDGNKKKKRKTR